MNIVEVIEENKIYVHSFSCLYIPRPVPNVCGFVMSHCTIMRIRDYWYHVHKIELSMNNFHENFPSLCQPILHQPLTEVSLMMLENTVEHCYSKLLQCGYSDFKQQ